MNSTEDHATLCEPKLDSKQLLLRSHSIDVYAVDHVDAFDYTAPLDFPAQCGGFGAQCFSALTLHGRFGKVLKTFPINKT